MKKVLNIYKPVGLTPLQVIEKLKARYKKYKDIKIGYAGRLDPLAHGVLILMVDEATKDRDEYLNQSKEYEVDILFGVETDSYDCLGMVTESTQYKIEANFINRVQNITSQYIGRQIQPYPAFSSKAVKGKPLFWWAKQDRLSEITIPSREIEVYAIKILNAKTISKTDLRRNLEIIKDVKGYFRQSEVLEAWYKFIDETTQNSFQTCRLKVSCSSGTYIRSIAQRLGHELGVGAIALEIYRTKVGEFDIKDSLSL